METINKLINDARNGDAASQQYLLEECQQCTVGLTYRNLRRAACFNMNYEDLRELTIPAFVKALNSYDPNKIGFYDYFKYLYLMQIKTEFRRKSSKTNSLLKIDTVPSIDEDYIMQFQSREYQESKEKYSSIDKERIYQLVVNERQVKMTDKEYKLIKMYFEDIEITEMARRLNKNYTETFRSLKRAIDKIKKHFETEI